MIAKAVEQEQRRMGAHMKEQLTALKREAIAKVADDQNTLLSELRKQEQEVCKYVHVQD